MPEGWFCYERVNGRVYRSKRSAVYASVHGDDQILAKYPLTAEEFETLSLDQLELKHPRPPDLKNVP